MLKFSSLLLFLLLSLPLTVQGASLNVIINEIAWMGTENSANDEWIELYNNGDEDINLEGWGLYEQGGLTLIEPLTGIIKAKSYYLVERTDDETVPDVEASQPPSSWGGRGLKNTGEHLQLLDNNSNIVDEVNYPDSWPAGSNETKQTMERTSSGNWQDSENPGGTPKAKNSISGVEKPAETPAETETPPAEEPAEIVTPQISYPSGIIFNEILPDPKGITDAEGEYIEIFNKNKEKINLSGWKIADTVGSSAKTYIFPEETIINGERFLVFYRATTKIILNNDGDSVSLIHPDGKVVDSVAYKEKAPKGESYNRTDSRWLWSATLTPGSENIIPKKEKRPLPAEGTESGSLTTESSVKKGTAAIGEKLTASSNYSITLLIALTVSIFSAIVILILKKVIK